MLKGSDSPRPDGQRLSMPAAGGAGRANEIIESIKKRHEVKLPPGKPLPARSTVGIVLEGVMVNIVVPGSPAYQEVMKNISSMPWRLAVLAFCTPFLALDVFFSLDSFRDSPRGLHASF